MELCGAALGSNDPDVLRQCFLHVSSDGKHGHAMFIAISLLQLSRWMFVSSLFQLGQS